MNIRKDHKIYLVVFDQLLYRLSKELKQATDDDVSSAFNMLLLKKMRKLLQRTHNSTYNCKEKVTYRECKLATAFYVGKSIRSVQLKMYILMVSVETMCSIKGSIVATGSLSTWESNPWP